MSQNLDVSKFVSIGAASRRLLTWCFLWRNGWRFVSRWLTLVSKDSCFSAHASLLNELSEIKRMDYSQEFSCAFRLRDGHRRRLQFLHPQWCSKLRVPVSWFFKSWRCQLPEGTTASVHSLTLIFNKLPLVVSSKLWPFQQTAYTVKLLWFSILLL